MAEMLLRIETPCSWSVSPLARRGGSEGSSSGEGCQTVPGGEGEVGQSTVGVDGTKPMSEQVAHGCVPIATLAVGHFPPPLKAVLGGSVGGSPSEVEQGTCVDAVKHGFSIVVLHLRVIPFAARRPATCSRAPHATRCATSTSATSSTPRSGSDHLRRTSGRGTATCRA